MDLAQDARHDGLPAALDLRILGPLEAWRGDRQLSLGGQRQRSVLACLLLDLGHNVPTERIVDAVWGERPPGGVQTTLQTYVFHLREALEPPRGKGDAPTVLVTVPGGYRVEPTAVTVDAARFDALVSSGRTALRTDPATASTQLGEALALWRGDVLSDLPSLDGVVTPVSARLGELRIVATELWAEAELALGHNEVLSALDGLVVRYPLREHLAALRMLALYRAGRQADALAAYRKLRRRLDGELGIRPSAEVEALHQRMLGQDPGLDLVAPAQSARDAIALQPSDRPPEGRSHGDQPPIVTERVGPASRTRRRRLAAVTAILVAAVTVLLASTFVARRGSLTPLPPNSVGPVNSAGLSGDAAVLDSPPSALVSAAGAVWAVLENADAVAKVDPRTRRVVQTVHGVGGSPQAIAASGDDLWVAGFDEKVLTRINAPTGIVTKKISVGVEPAAVVAGPDGVWVANSGDNTIQHVDPATEKADAPIGVGDGPDALAIDGSTLWVANGRAGTVSQMNLQSGQRVKGDIKVDAGPVALAVTATDVWVANEFGQSVSRIPHGSERAQRIDVDDGPSSLVVLDDEVWVSNQYSATLSRIDMATNQVEDQLVHSAPRAMTVVDGEVWASTGAFASEEHRGGTLVWTGYPGADFDALDPAGGTTPEYVNLIRMVYDGLVANRISAGRSSFGLVPDLATSIPEPSDGGRTYVFTLRPDIHYSTGGVVKASDFVRGLRRFLHPDTANNNSFDAIVGVESCTGSGDAAVHCDLTAGVDADDASGRLTFHLSRPDPEFLNKLALGLYPAPPGTPIEPMRSTSPPGTGPYQVGAVDKGSVTLVRNPLFRQWSAAAQPDGYPDVIAYRLATSDQTAVVDLLGGRAQGSWNVNDLPPAITSQPAYFRHFDLLNGQYIFPNATQRPFNDVRVRRALSYAIDRNRIAEMAKSDVACQMVPRSFPGFRRYCPYQIGPADGPYRGPDVATARRLVAESGTTGVPITVWRGHYSILGDIAQYVASVLADLGYTSVDVREVPAGLNGAFDPFYDSAQIMVPIGWLADYPSPGSFYDFVAACRNRHFNRYCNPQIEAKANEARALASSDPSGSLAAWSEVDKMVVDDAAIIATHAFIGQALVSPSLGNVILRPTLGPVLDQIWVR